MFEAFKRVGSKLSGLITLVLLMVGFVQVHWALWYYFDLEFDAQKVLAETATGGIIGAAYGFLSPTSKRYLALKSRQVIDSAQIMAGSAAIVLCLVVVALAVNRTKIKWPPGYVEIVIDGQTMPSDVWTDANPNETSVIGNIFSRRQLRVGDFVASIGFRPIVPVVYDIPETAIYPSRPDYQQIVTLLALSFYQSTENRFLSEAKERFTSETAKKYVDLNSVYDILKLCFIDSNVSRSGEKLLGVFEEQSATSPWIPLLKSCLKYSEGDFATAANDLEQTPANLREPLSGTFTFFRGVNYLREYIDRANNKNDRDAGLLAKAVQTFTDAGHEAGLVPDDYFKEIAEGSSLIFEGIGYVYSHDNDRASDAFKAAAKSSYPELRARSFSDLGYVTLLRGDLSKAKDYFDKALEADPAFPYAQTNLGYALLAQGQYDAAKDLFTKLVADKDLAHDSMRDVILSQIAIAHIDSDRGVNGSPNPDAYNDALKELGIFNYQGTSPPEFRLARIRVAIADKIYMSHDYYGLEMLALAMYARAFYGIAQLEQTGEGAPLSQQISTSFKNVAATLDPRCFIFHIDHGFFKPVADLSAQLKITR